MLALGKSGRWNKIGRVKTTLSPKFFDFFRMEARRRAKNQLEISVSNLTKHAPTLLFGVLIPAAVIGVGVGAFITLGKQQPKQAVAEGNDAVSKLRKLPIVTTGVVEASESLQSLDISVSGIVVPYRQINLAAEVAGRVQSKSELCQIGRYVKKGDVLFELDSTDFALEVERLETLRAAEVAQQSELDQDIANSLRSLELAEEELALQEKELARIQSLPKGFASDTELDQSRRQRVASANQRLAIQNQLRALETRRTRIALAERLAAAQLQQARVNLSRTKIVSPIDGVIVTENVQADSFVQRGDTLCVIEDTEHVEVSCNLRTDQLLLVLEQNAAAKSADPVIQSPIPSSYELPETPVTVSYRISGRDELRFDWNGKLSRYEGLGLDTQSRTVPIRIRVDSPSAVVVDGKKLDDSSKGIPALVRGMFVECRIHTQTPRNTVLVPKLSLKPGNHLWKFSRNDSLVASDQEAQSNDSGSSQQEVAPAAKNAAVSINPDQWVAGDLQVLTEVKVLGLVQAGSPQSDFWIVEAGEKLLPGDLLVVSPLANVLGDGSDRVRYQLPQENVDPRSSVSGKAAKE